MIKCSKQTTGDKCKCTLCAKKKFEDAVALSDRAWSATKRQKFPAVGNAYEPIDEGGGPWQENAIRELEDWDDGISLGQ